MEYSRSWEEDSAINEFNLNVVVEEGDIVAEDPVSVVPSIVTENNITTMNLSITNNLEKDIKITYPTSQKVDFILQSADGKELYQWSDGYMFLQVITRSSIPAGKTVNYSVKAVIDKSILEKSAVLKGYITGTSKDFVIKKVMH